MYSENVKKTFLISVAATILLLVVKFCAGFSSRSLALVYDGIESAADILIFISLYGATLLASKPPDAEHQYGHTKIENLASLLLGLLIASGGTVLAYEAFKGLTGKKTAFPPEAYAFFVAVAVVVVKEALYFYTRKQAKATGSPVLSALAIDHHKDALSSLVTVVGTTSGILRISWLDFLAAFLTSLVILGIGLSTFYSSSSDLLDKSPDLQTLEKIKQATLSVNGVERISSLRARKSGKDIYVDVDIEVNANLSVEEAHEIASRVQEKMSAEISNIKGVVVHVEPHKKA